jgi:hypothetical protein
MPLIVSERWQAKWMRSYDEVVKEYEKLRRSAEVETMGLSKYGNGILMVTVGNGDTSVLIVCR